MVHFNLLLLTIASLCGLGRSKIKPTAADDLMSFVTRPELRPPKFRVHVHKEELVAPGYWFLAPYSIITPEAPSAKWSPCQVGPHIYDSNGLLVWSGACLFDNRNIFDFKAATNIDNKSHLSFILQHKYQGDRTQRGAGIVLSERYEREHYVPVTNELAAFNMHEFNILEGGKTALVCTYKNDMVDLASMGWPGKKGPVTWGGFEELDVATGNVLFRWKSLDHVPLSDSSFYVPQAPNQLGGGWDYIHVNSVDKNANGDYLLSSRFTNTIFLISGKDGHIIWRLGGKRSDFQQDFKFSRQHHARFIQSNDNETIISFLNNASDEVSQQEDISSALFVSLNTAVTPMKATVVKRFNRPDHGLTRLRGNVETLPNGNVFVGWSEHGYHSEFTSNGTLVMEARFLSQRYGTYRAYKFDFKGLPLEPPVLKSFAYGSDAHDSVSVFYVSWNGATDVASYNFYSKDSNGTATKIGNAKKTGFETTHTVNGFFDRVSAEALDANGAILGQSNVERTRLSAGWFPTGHSTVDAVAGEVDDLNVSNDTELSDTEVSLIWLYRILAPVGAFTVFMLFVGIAVGSVMILLPMMLKLRKRRQYSEVPKEDERLMAAVEHR